MKYLKSFESNENKTFWLVKTKMPHFEIALNKLGLTPTTIFYFLNNNYIKKFKFSKIFIPIDLLSRLNNSTVYNLTVYYNASNKYFNYNTNSIVIGDFFESSKSDLEDHGFNYMGEVKITKQDLLDWKINDKAKKYR
jgi:hypothetical protein